METIYVIGSINMDLVVGVPRFPAPGETLTGTRFAMVPGGKGANQAVALARLGAPAAMVGLVGRDAFGDQYIANFAQQGVDASLVGRCDAATGVALIEVDDSGENHIVVVRGANDRITPEWIDRALPPQALRGIVLMQLEIPMPAVLHAAARICAAGGTLILDPAPMQDMPGELLSLADVITPNEHELVALTRDLPPDTPFQQRMQALKGLGARTLLHKRGPHGAFLMQGDQIEHIPAFKVDAVDTTAAGDSFNAGFACGLAQGLPLAQCARLACAVGALSTTRFGAQGGMPTMHEAEALMRG